MLFRSSRPLEPGTTIEIQAGGDAADPPTIDFIGYSDPAPVDPYRIVQAEDFATERGTRPGESELAVGYIEDGDYLLFNVVLGAGPRAGTVFASSNTGGGTIEFRLNEPDGPLLGTSTIESTTGWSDFDPFPIVLAEEFADGGDFPAQSKLYLVFRGPDGFLFDVNGFVFREEAPPVDPYQTVQAEDFDRQLGTRPGGSGIAVGFIQDGDYIAYDAVDFGRGPAEGTLRASSNGTGGMVEFRTLSPSGPLFATSTITATGGWSTFQDFPIDVSEDFSDGTAFLGTRSLYLVFRGEPGFLFDVDAFSFTSADVPVTGVAFTNCPSTLTVGQTFDLNAQVIPENAVNQTVRYGSSSTDVVSVDDIIDGTIVAQAPGTATVSVTAFDGGFRDFCEITVSGASARATLPQGGAATERLSAYPNPSADGRFHILTTTPEGTDLTVTDLRGRVVRTVSEPGSSSLLDLSDLPGGVYILRTARGSTLRLVRQ